MKTTTMIFTIEIPNDLLDEYGDFEYEADIYYQDREDDWNWKKYQNVEGKLVELEKYLKENKIESNISN